jgi:hypothetical protein
MPKTKRFAKRLTPDTGQATDQMISPVKLSKLSRYSLQELRKLAACGYFPKATAKGYPRKKAIKGCLEARHDKITGASGLPIYTSMGQAASRTGIPIAVFRQEKKLGSSAFTYNRVNLGLFLKGLFSKNGEQQESQVLIIVVQGPVESVGAATHVEICGFICGCRVA